MHRTNERTERRSSDEGCPLGRHQAVGRELGPGWDSPGRVAERERSRAEMRAGQRGYQLAQLRKNAGLTQAQVAALMGATQARVAQIEHGKITEVDAMRRCPGRTEGLSGRTLCPRTLLTGIGTSRVVALDHVLPWVLMTWQ
jgi:DNA-binding XRE family transcriptional regulator